METKTGKPKYQQIKDLLLGSIQSGALDDGACLPPERELCERYDVSRVTVRKAIKELEDEGAVYRIQGKGTFLRRPQNKITQVFTRLTSFTEDMLSRGMTAGSRILLTEQVAASAEIAEKLDLAPGAPVILFRRLRLADGEPMAIETSYLNDKLFHPMLDKYTGGSFYSFMRDELGLVPRRAVQSLEVADIPEWEAKLLGDPGRSVALLMCRQTFDASDRPIEYVVSKYRSDKYRFHIELYNL